MKKLFFALVALSLTSLVGCKETKTKKYFDDIVFDENTPEYLARNIETLYTEDAQNKMLMKAPVQMRFTNGNEKYPNGIDITAYDEKGLIQSTIIADSAYYTFADTLYSAFGNVVLIDKLKGQKLETDTLYFNNETGDVFTDAKVRITQDGQIVTGVGMRANRNDPTDYELDQFEGSVLIDD